MDEIDLRTEEVRKLVSAINESGQLRRRENTTVEFKQSFNFGSAAAYAKTMAAFANTRGGYIVFGVKDKPREVIGLKTNNFENFPIEKFTSALNSLFAPEIEWETGSLAVSLEMFITDENGEMTTKVVDKCIGWIYVLESDRKPVIAQKEHSGEHIVSGDVFYRYVARSEKIKLPEMSKIIEENVAKERERLMKLFELIRKSGTANLGIVNYANGKFTTPQGVDVEFDQRLVAKVLKKARFIKQGSFDKTKGIPVIKVTGNIDLAEEIPVPEGNPDDTHPYIQKQLAEKLNISTQDLYALIWYYKMKEAKRYHLEITVSSSGKTHKFSEFALQFLEEKLGELKDNETEFDKIRAAYKNRNKQEETTNA